jgi:hypothetical protein
MLHLKGDHQQPMVQTAVLAPIIASSLLLPAVQ